MDPLFIIAYIQRYSAYFKGNIFATNYTGPFDGVENIDTRDPIIVTSQQGDLVKFSYKNNKVRVSLPMQAPNTRFKFWTEYGNDVDDTYAQNEYDSFAFSNLLVPPLTFTENITLLNPFEHIYGVWSGHSYEDPAGENARATKCSLFHFTLNEDHHYDINSLRFMPNGNVQCEFSFKQEDDVPAPPYELRVRIGDVPEHLVEQRQIDVKREGTLLQIEWKRGATFVKQALSELLEVPSNDTFIYLDIPGGGWAPRSYIKRLTSSVNEVLNVILHWMDANPPSTIYQYLSMSENDGQLFFSRAAGTPSIALRRQLSISYPTLTLKMQAYQQIVQAALKIEKIPLVERTESQLETHAKLLDALRQSKFMRIACSLCPEDGTPVRFKINSFPVCDACIVKYDLE